MITGWSQTCGDPIDYFIFLLSYGNDWFVTDNLEKLLSFMQHVSCCKEKYSLVYAGILNK